MKTYRSIVSVVGPVVLAALSAVAGCGGVGAGAEGDSVGSTSEALGRSAAALDPWFGTGGRVFTPALGFAAEIPAAVVPMAGGKILLGATEVSSANKAFIVRRYLANGSADATFGTLGRATLAFLAPGTSLTSLLVQPDGRIVAVGHTYLGGQGTCYALARYLTNGALDATFGREGLATMCPPSGIGEALAAGLTSDGKILVAGATLRVPAGVFAGLTRFEPNGAVDTSFGVAGTATLGRTGFSANALAIQPDGRIVLAGDVFVSGSVSTTMGVERYLATGAPDATFGDLSFTEIDFGRDAADSAHARALLVQRDGKLLIAGEHLRSGRSGDFLYGSLARLTPSGALDGAFGTLGRVDADLGEAHGSFVGVALLRDGSIVAGGPNEVQSASRGALAHYDANGTLDTSLGIFGVTSEPIAFGFDPTAMRLLPPDVGVDLERVDHVLFAGTARGATISTTLVDVNLATR